MGKLFKEKSKRGRNLFLILIPLIVLTLVFCFLAFNSVKGLLGSATGIGASGSSGFSNSIEEYDYHLRSNATSFQKSLFSELEDECDKTKKDDQKIAVLVAKNFVADFYTWSNKNGTIDVGGMYYVYSPNRKAILYQSRRYLYQHLNSYISKYGQNNLLEVESFTSEPGIEVGTIEIGGKTYTTYNFALEWKYKEKSGGFDTSAYATRSQFLVYKNGDNRFEILNIGE